MKIQPQELPVGKPERTTESVPVLVEEKRPVLSEASLEVLRGLGDKAELVAARRRIWNSSYMPEASYSHEETVEIPDRLESKESLEFLGFKPEKAGPVCAEWEEECRSHGPLVGLLEKAVASIDCHPRNAVDAGDDWEGVLGEMGVNRELICRIMDPRWQEWRLRGSAKEWVCFVFSERQEFLKSLDAVIRTRGTTEGNHGNLQQEAH